MTKYRTKTTPLLPGIHLSTLRRKPRSAQQILKDHESNMNRKRLNHPGNADGSCQEALYRLREQADFQKMKTLPSVQPSAYVQARKRLDVEELRESFYYGAGAIEEVGDVLHSERPWIVVDGTGLISPGKYMHLLRML